MAEKTAEEAAGEEYVAKEPEEPWRIDTNDRYREVVKLVTTLATGALVLPVFFLRAVLVIPSNRPLTDVLNCRAYLSSICLALSIFSGLVFHYVSGKWVRLAWDQPVGFFRRESKSKRTKAVVETILEVSLWGTILFFGAGIGLVLWFVVTFAPTTAQSPRSDQSNPTAVQQVQVERSSLQTPTTGIGTGARTPQQTNSGDAHEMPWLGPETAPQWAVVIVAIAAACVAWKTLVVIGKQTDIANLSAEAVMLAERAYVKMSHHSGPGLRFDPNGVLVMFSIEVRNNGHTPADVLGGVLDLKFDALPDKRSYRRMATDEFPGTFLVANDNVNWNGVLRADAEDLRLARLGQRRMWLVGYVDYRDRFKRRHRGGYARRFDQRFEDTTPEPERNNLVFDESAGHWNYDEELRESD
jgi:hypothetical protein